MIRIVLDLGCFDLILMCECKIQGSMKLGVRAKRKKKLRDFGAFVLNLSMGFLRVT